MKNIVFTICSNNYLAQASLLAESFIRENPDFDFYIGLVDVIRPDIKYPVADNLYVVPCEEVVPAEQLSEMVRVYKIVELNTSVKPFYISYFFSNNPECKVIYLDPDIYVYNSFKEVINLLDVYDFIITPHILSPIPLDDQFPQERVFVKYGIYNLGFIALRKGEQSISFVNWWKERLAVLCYSETQMGIFVDQSWVGFLPVYYRNVHISDHPGMNAAFWNLHERYYQVIDNRFYVNKVHPLIFFHFSSFNLNDINSLAKNGTRYTLKDRPDLKKLFEDYGANFRNAKKMYNSNVECFYTKRTLMQKAAYYWNRYKIRKLMQ